MAKQEPDKPDTKRRVELIERRIQNPFGAPSAEIRLKDRSLEPRWFNTALRADRIWLAKEQGWDGVKPDMLADPEQIGAFKVSANGYVCRGEREQEVLMCMPRADRAAIQQAKTRVNIDRMKRPNAVKQDVANAAGQHIGSEAADFIHNKMRVVGDVNTSYERVERLQDVEG